MQFKLSINKDRVYYDEDIHMVCTIDKGDGQTILASGFKHTKLLIINIFDSDDNLYKSIPGNQTEFRQIPPNRDMMLTGINGKFTPDLHKEYNFKINLFNYSDPIPSGEYSIQMQIYSLDRQNLFETNKASLTVLPRTKALSFDSIRYDDESDLQRLLSAQIYEDHLQLHHSPCDTPYNPNYRFTFENKCNADKIIIAESNITSSNNRRYLIITLWQDQNKLFCYTYKPYAIDSGVMSTAIADGSELVGRPVFDADLNISIFLLEQDEQGYFLSLNHFSQELSPTGKRTITCLEQKPIDILSSAYNKGAIDLLIVNQSHFPLTHIRIDGEDITSTSINLPETELLEQDDDILFCKLNTRFHQKPQGSISLVLKDNPSNAFLTAVVIDTTDPAQQIKMSRRYQLPHFIIDEIDKLTMVKTFTINKGRVREPERLEFITIFCFDNTLYVFDEPNGMYTVETPENTDMDNINLILDHHRSAFLIIPSQLGGYTTELIYSPFRKM